MSDYSSVAPPQNFNKSQAFAAALQRAKQIAAKINPGGGDGGTKRPLEDCGPEPESKKLASRLDSSPPQGNRSSGPLLPQMAPPALAPPGLGGPVTSEDIKVPDKMVGLIIGRGGEQITRLQSESGCKIQMAPDSGGMPDRLCTLTGNAAAIGRAKELVNAIVNQRYKTEGPGGGSGAQRGPPMDEMAPQRHPGGGAGGPSFVEVMIPGPKVGLVIGKGGETIKMLQEKSGAKMVVIQEGPNQEVEKPLRITGDPLKVEHARTLVYDLLAEKENQQQQRGGGGPGRGGANRGGYNERGGQQRFQNRGSDESQFVVPASKCGVIIGRGGETIKQINQATGAHCELDRRPNNNPNEKVFVIRGTPEQIEAAKQMIGEKLGQSLEDTRVSDCFQGGPGANGGPAYGGPGGPGNPQGGYPQSWAPPGPAYAQPYHQQHMDPSAGMGAMGGQGQAQQPDYSQQWIEYYRSMGMHQEADEIELQTKVKQSAQGPQNNSMQGTGGSAPVAPNNPIPAQQNNAAQPLQNGQPDYSAQWAQYYRSLGKIKEAELIEQQMKNKQATGVTQMPVGAQSNPNPPSFSYQQPGGYPYQPVAYPYQPTGGYQYTGVAQPQQNQDQ
ncbi:far upstream element-binding protein 2 isoform X2 [Cimex lectularius]|uniref:K Homology domain-containing protein n=1 Tax=Cimex lectularius TaxID=79782 RepID=A0A8I6RAR0_CIMLE|nr:far upstream element-binding protein 2 isoform X2 [Cimex lectularius]